MRDSESPSRRRTELLGKALLASWAIWICLERGAVGFMPLDQSIVFDGAWRLLQGQAPWRDVSMPAGLVPAALQTPFFALLGVDWDAYRLHAALANAAFALLVASLGRALGAHRPSALAGGALAAVLFYPPMGVPYIDQHAWLFSLLALRLGVAAARGPGGPGFRAAALLLPAALAAAFLSKPIPTLLVAPLALLAAGAARRRGAALLLLGVGAAAAIAALLVAFGAWGSRPELFREHVLERPALLGGARWRALLAGQTPFWSSSRLVVTLGLVHAATAAGLLLAWRRGAGRTAGVLLLGWGLLVANHLFIALTRNQPENALAPLAAALVVTLAGWCRLGDATAPGRGASALLAFVVLGAATVETWSFDREVNRRRSVLEIDVSEGPPPKTVRRPVALAGMRWRTPELYPGGPEDLAALVEDLRSRPGAFLYFGDASIVYGLCGKPSINPVLWFHPGLCEPMPDAPDRATWELRLLESMRRHDVRRLVIEAERTWNDARPEHFRLLAAALAQRTTPHRVVGRHAVIEIAPSEEER